MKAEPAPALEPAIKRSPQTADASSKNSRHACGRRSGALSGRGAAPVTTRARAWWPRRLLLARPNTTSIQHLFRTVDGLTIFTFPGLSLRRPFYSAAVAQTT